MVTEGFHGAERTLIVGNFGDGTLNAFNVGNREFLGQLTDSTGAVIQIDGLWGLALSGNGQRHGEGHERLQEEQAAFQLFFASGPNGEANGLFGSLTANLA